MKDKTDEMIQWLDRQNEQDKTDEMIQWLDRQREQANAKMVKTKSEAKRAKLWQVIVEVDQRIKYLENFR